MPIKGAAPNKGAPYGLGALYTVHSDQNRLNFLNIWPIFNPKPPLESSESQHLLYDIRFDLAIAPCAFIRHITVSLIASLYTHTKDFCLVLYHDPKAATTQYRSIQGCFSQEEPIVKQVTIWVVLRGEQINRYTLYRALLTNLTTLPIAFSITLL